MADDPYAKYFASSEDNQEPVVIQNEKAIVPSGEELNLQPNTREANLYGAISEPVTDPYARYFTEVPEKNLPPSDPNNLTSNYTQSIPQVTPQDTKDNDPYAKYFIEPSETPIANQLTNYVESNIGKVSSKDVPGTQGGNLGCAAIVCKVFKNATGQELVPNGTLSTGEEWNHLTNDPRFQTLPVDQAQAGDIIVTAAGSKHGHTGFVLPNGEIASNNSSNGILEKNYDLQSWMDSIGKRNPQQTAVFRYVGNSIPQQQSKEKGQLNDPYAGLFEPSSTNSPTPEQTGKVINLPAYNPIENALKNFANTAATSTLNSIGGAVRYFNSAQQKDLKMAQDELAQAQASGASSDQKNEIQGRIDSLNEQVPQVQEAAKSISNLSAQYPEAYGVNPEDKSTSAQIGRGLGQVASFIPTMAFGPAGAPMGALQGASQAYEGTYQQTLQNLQSQGVTDKALMEDKAQREASNAAVKSLPQLAVYMVGGKLASEGVSKLLSTQTPLIQGVAGAVAGSIMNTAAGATIRKFMGESVMPTVESLTQDIAFGLFHGVGTGVEAQQKLQMEEQKRKLEEQKLGGPTPKVAPSTNPDVNKKESEILASADAQYSPPLETKVEEVTTSAVTPSGETKAPAADLTSLLLDQTLHEEGSPEYLAIQKQIDALKTPAPAEVTPAKGPTPKLPATGGELTANLVESGTELESFGKETLSQLAEHYGIDIPEGASRGEIIDAIKERKPAEAPIAEAQPETPNAVQVEKAGEVGVRNPPAVGEGMGAENKPEVPATEGQTPKEEIAPTGRKPVGISKAAIKDQRLNRLVEELPESERQSNADKINDALEINNESQRPVESLISDILEGENTNKSPEDVALLTVELNRLQLEREKLQDEFNKIKDPRPSDYALLNRDIKIIDDKINRVDRAVDKIGTQAGRLLQMFKIMLDEDYSQVGLERKAEKVVRRKLTEEEKQIIAQQAKEDKELVKARDKTKEAEILKAENDDLKTSYQNALKQIESLKAKAKKVSKEPVAKKGKPETPIDQKIVDKLNALAEKIRQERKGKLYARISPVDIGDVIIGASHLANGLKSFKDWSVKMASEIKGATKDYLKKVWDAAHEKLNSFQERKTPDDIKARIKAEAVAGEELSHKSVDDLVKARLEEGLRGEDEVMKAVHEDIKEAYPNATERDVRRAFVEYGKKSKVNPDELLQRKRQLRTLVRLQESIDRLNEGIPALKTNSKREKAIQEIREKQKQLNELLKTVKAPPTDEQLATAYSKKKTALENAIEDLDKQLRTGERPKPKTRAEEPVDIEQLRSELDAMRRKREEIDKEEAPKFSAQEKENERLRKLYDKQISELDAKLQGAEKPKPEKTAFEQSLENEQKMAERDAMRQKLKEIEKEEADRKKPSAEQKEIDRLQKAIADVNDLITKGEKTAPTPKREPLTEYAKKLQEDLKKAREQFKRNTGKKPESKEDRYNRRRIEFIEKEIARMEDLMKREDYSKPAKKEPPKKYPATELAESKLKAKRRAIDAWREEKEKAERPLWERSLRKTSETIRELTVAGINVLYKIGKYAVLKPLIFPVSETSGYTAKHLLGFGKVRGGLESGASPLTTIPAYYRGYWKGMKQFFRTLKAGESDSQLLYDKRLQNNTNWARWIGSNLHASIKNLPATAMEEVYKEHLYANALANGIDIHDPMAQAALNLQAYNASKSAKLMEDNKVSEKINELHDWAESPDKTGKINPYSSLASHGIKILFTKGIYKIGLNFLKQTIQGQTGILRGISSTLNGHWKGLDNLTPQEVDYITRAFKMGSVPAALMALAVMDAFRDDKDRIFGGYYEQGRKQGDVKWGHVRINGKEYALHLPEIEAAQFVNTMARSFIKNQKKTDMGMSAINSFLEAMGGIISEAPVAGPMIEIAHSPTHAGQYLVQGMVPSASRDIAKMTDVNEKGEPTHRYPKGIKENIEMGIPGLRKEVSSIKPSGSSSVGTGPYGLKKSGGKPYGLTGSRAKPFGLK